MRVYPTSPSSAVPANRNGASIVNWFYAAAIAPHGATVRVSYTVPATRKFLSSGFNIQIGMITAAGANAERGLYGQITPSGGAAASAIALLSAASPPTSASALSGLQGQTYLSGDNVAITTTDGGTGGTWTYFGSIVGTLYDA